MKELSDRSWSVWAKSDRDTGSSLALWSHMRDSCEVAGQLWDEWLPDAVKAQIRMGTTAGSEAEARTLVRWIAAVHDAGKAHPAFAHQVDSLAGRMQSQGLRFPAVISRDQKIPHSTLSHVIIRRWLEERWGFDGPAAKSLAVVPGGHHGVPPSETAISAAREATELLDDAWLQTQNELLDACTDFAGAVDVLPQWKHRRVTVQAQMLLTATVIVADWIASNPDLFPYEDPSAPDERLRRAWVELNLAPPWRAPEPPVDLEQLFAQRFDLPDGAVPNAMQTEAVFAARNMGESGLMIIEAAMGQGKTEAAFAVAEVFAARFGCGGALIALPTQSTSDAMFSRFPRWVDKLPDWDDRAARSIYLAHSKAGLNEDFARMARRTQRLRAIGDGGVSGRASEHEVIAHQWLFGRKKGLLADFVVGTVDQVLFAALQSKHVVLRHLALAGKVVIIDEVHAYDTYMNAYLHRALHWLGAYRVPVIMLSATLPAASRKALMAAYDAGRAVASTRVEPDDADAGVTTRRRRRRGQKLSAPHVSPLDGNPGYPLIVTSSPTGPQVCVAHAGNRRLEVTMTTVDDDAASLHDVLAPVHDGGGCVGIICNTVDRAQQAYALAADMFGDEAVLLNHSRFVVPHRMETERRLRTLLGPDDVVTNAGNERPETLIVIGTQVLEQSLDIDFDLLITDFAPADLLLQRIGRLHRRRNPARSRPPHLARPACLVRAIEHNDNGVPEFDGGAEAIYGSAVLLRSAATLQDRLSGTIPVTLPDHISDIVQDTYSSTIAMPQGWEERFATAERERTDKVREQIGKAGVFILDTADRPEKTAVGLLDRFAGNADDDAKAEARGAARVRDTDETIEVIVMYRDPDGQATFLPGTGDFADEIVPENDAPSWTVARALSACTIRLPRALCRSWTIDRTLDELEDAGVAAWQQSRWLKGQLFLFLDQDLEADLAGYRLRYDRQIGLTHSKLAESDAP